MYVVVAIVAVSVCIVVDCCCRNCLYSLSCSLVVAADRCSGRFAACCRSGRIAACGSSSHVAAGDRCSRLAACCRSRHIGGCDCCRRVTGCGHVLCRWLWSERLWCWLTLVKSQKQKKVIQKQKKTFSKPSLTTTDIPFFFYLFF